MQIRTHACMHGLTCARTQARTHAHSHARTHAGTQARRHVGTHVRACTHTCTHARTHAGSHTHARTHTHMNTRTQARSHANERVHNGCLELFFLIICLTKTILLIFSTYKLCPQLLPSFIFLRRCPGQVKLSLSAEEVRIS